TRPLNFPAPMVVRLKTRESRSLPGLPRTEFPLHMFDCKKPPRPPGPAAFLFWWTHVGRGSRWSDATRQARMYWFDEQADAVSQRRPARPRGRRLVLQAR